jgi:hypothetical protein
MSTYQKLQPGGARNIIPSDTINIPPPALDSFQGENDLTEANHLNSLTIAKRVQEGTQTAVTANKLEDVGADFTVPTPVVVGNTVVNTTTNARATVTDVDSSTILTLDANIFAAGDQDYAVYQGGFLGVSSVGDVVADLDAGTFTTVKAVDSSTKLELNDDLFTGTEDFIVYDASVQGINAAQSACVVYVGDASGSSATWSELQVMTADRSIVTFSHFPTGTFLPVQVLRVFSTSTTATNLIALW